MKKIVVLVFALALTFGASAQTSFSQKMKNCGWKQSGLGFKYPSFMSHKNTFIGDVPASVDVYSYGGVKLCYWSLGAWAVNDFPEEGNYVSDTDLVNDITYTSRTGVVSGWTDEGNIFYLKKVITEGRDTYHAKVLALVYPQKYQQAVSPLIKIVQSYR